MPEKLKLHCPDATCDGALFGEEATLMTKANVLFGVNKSATYNEGCGSTCRSH